MSGLLPHDYSKSVFAMSGKPTPDLLYLIHDISPPSDVKTVGKGNVHCNGLSRCLRIVHGGGPRDNYGISSLRGTDAECTRFVDSEAHRAQQMGNLDYFPRYTGRCKVDDHQMAGWFLVECKKDANDYVVVKYAKDESEFVTHGNAKALFSKRSNVKAEELKKGTHKTLRSAKDIFVYCPS